MSHLKYILCLQLQNIRFDRKSIVNNKLKEIILPIEEKPSIVSRNIHAIRLSIIQKCDEQGINYVYNNYIQLMFRTESNGHVTFDYTFPRYKNLSTFRTCSVDKPTFTINSINIKDFIIRGLLCKKYVITSVDEFYVENRIAYNSHHFGHDILLYGFNAEKNVFHIIGYTNSGHYQPSTIDCDEFVIAYLNSYGNKSIDLVETVSYYHHRIEKDLIAASLEDYINSDNKSRLFDKSKWLDDNETYGINTIEKVKLYLDDIVNDRVYFDKRVIYTLMEHKRIMLERYEHLLKHGFIKRDDLLKNDLSEIYSKSCIAFGLYLKYFAFKNTSSLLKIIPVLDEIKNLEIKAIPRFTEKIKEGAI